MKMVVFGAGKIGRYIIDTRPCDNNEIRYIMDNKQAEIEIQYKHIPIIKPESLEGEQRNKLMVVIALKDFNVAMEVACQLFDEGYRQLFLLHESVLNRHESLWNADGTLDQYKVTKLQCGEKGRELLPTLKYLEMHVANGCNLNCKGCTHFSNLYQKNDLVDLEDFSKQLEILSKKCNLLKLRLMGGEPLLNPQIERYLETARCNFPTTELYLVTNGLLLLSKHEEFFDKLKELHIIVCISWYPPTAGKRDEILRKLDEHGVLHMENLEDIYEFTKCLTLQHTHDGEQAIKKCGMAKCTILKDYKIYKCSFMAYCGKLNERFGTNLVQEKGFSIESSVEEWKEMLSRLEEPMPFCRYCTDTPVAYEWNGGRVPALEDWIV